MLVILYAEQAVRKYFEKFQTKRVWALQASVYDYDESDDHDLIGEFTLNVPQMMQAVDREVPL